MTDINQAVLPTQDQWKFIDELKKPVKRYFAWTRKEKGPGEADLSCGITVKNDFPDPESRLETALDDLKKFFEESPVPDTGSFPVVLKKGEAGPNDSFRIEITEKQIVITAQDVEGIRRGIFYLEDLLLTSDGPFLKCGITERKAWLRNRISRCFFGPIKRPPMNRDELLDDFDYYPEAYLNRLAHEGINGLWLTVELKDLARTSITPDAAPDSERRLAKLKRTADKCLRYGIRTFLFMIEPISWNASDPILKAYPELGGAVHAGGKICFCPSSETADKYLFESTNYIFSRVPELGGIINISIGEKTTTCLSSVAFSEGNAMNSKVVQCPRCSQKPLREAIYRSVAAMTKGMRAASPNAEFISWYYASSPAEMTDEFFTLSKLPEGATLLINFETGGHQTQCGKDLVGGDYWLSYVGPSPRFERMMNALPEGTGRGAKLQVGCSHEIASVPYVPVPGLLYRKYKEMRRLNVTTAMQCWYFGNYPGLMNKAAGMLAFEDFSAGEEDFLARLAAPYWGKNAGTFSEIWKMASDAYGNYPFSTSVQYHGPFHDSVVWPLYPFYRYQPLMPTWRADNPVSGDMIGECLREHTLPEAEELSRKITELWHKAAVKAGSFRKEYAAAPEQLADLDLMEALDILFASAHNVFLFYLLRSEGKGFTNEMRTIMKQEIANSGRMKELCEKDSRLGFHPEAENYRFFPQKLALRIRFLEEMLEDPLPELPAEVLPITDEWHEADGFSWKIAEDEKYVKISTIMRTPYRVDQIFAALQGKPEVWPAVIGVTKQNQSILVPPGSRLKAWTEGNVWRAEFEVPWSSIQVREDNTFRLEFTRLLVDKDEIEYRSCPAHGSVMFRLGIGYHSPQCMLTFKKK